MPLFAKILNNNIENIREYANRPEDIPHKNISWLPVEESIDEINHDYQEYGHVYYTIEQDKVIKKKEVFSISREKLIEYIILERERRLSLGFFYDFGDSRGIHQIGTTSQDMKGWDEVTKAATCFVNLGFGNQTMSIVTNTGPVEISAIEWLQIIAFATSERQPIWAASFALQMMDPIPNNYKNDIWWNM